MSGGAEDFLPDRLNLTALRRAADGCRGCGLYRDATATVFGEGRVGSRLMVVGEQPGDREDRSGKPFVGPAGRLLDELLVAAGIDRKTVYVTNAVKHFKWIAKGKRRIHQRPAAEELTACRPWLEAELAVVEPEVLLCLGATAAKAVLGSKFRVTTDRGKFFAGSETRLESFGGAVSATLHPSALLRIDDEEERRLTRASVVDDLSSVVARIDRGT